MNCHLARKQERSDGIFSDLYAETSELLAQTLEHAYKAGALWKAKIVPGTYTCKRSTHRIHWHDKELDPLLASMGAKLVDAGGVTLIEFETFEVLGVPGCTGILFHWGCFNDNSDGCILLGDHITRTPEQVQMLTNSRQAWVRFMKAQEKVDTFTLTVD